MTQHWDEDKLPDFEFDKHIKEWNVNDIQKEPYKTPEGLDWDELDLTDDVILSELHQFLKENYIEDSESKFRLEYPKAFVAWALLGPAWFKDWHVGLRAKATGQLMGFVSGTPLDLRANRVK
jgi:glycylpeptide N-tetradecanoyltransferase